jgi:hypothetical protein
MGLVVGGPGYEFVIWMPRAGMALKLAPNWLFKHVDGDSRNSGTDRLACEVDPWDPPKGKVTRRPE